MPDFTTIISPERAIIQIPPGVLQLGAITITIETNIVNPPKVQAFGQWIIDHKSEIDTAIS